MSEVWMKIPGYPDRFEVSDLGRVRTTDHVYERTLPNGKRVESRLGERVLKQSTGPQGYLTVNTGVRGKCRTTGVHRLVALAFLGEPEMGQEVNHINGIKHDNRVQNLEWVTRAENTRHSYRCLSRKPCSHKTAVVAVSDSGETLEFPSMLAAANRGGFTLSAIGRAVHKSGGFHKGYRWYKKDINEVHPPNLPARH